MTFNFFELLHTFSRTLVVLLSQMRFNASMYIRTMTLRVGILQRNRKSQTSRLPFILATYKTAGRVVLQCASDGYCIIGL